MMKKVLAALLAVCMLASLMFIPASAAGFDDVADDHWAKEAIDRWADFGVLEGSDGSFRPDANMNRAEFAAMVVRLMGLTNKSGKTFADVEADSSLNWAKDYIDIAATNGIIGGYPDGSFGGKREVTFQAGATMLTRALGLATVEETSGENYATGASAKLEELGMLDDNVKTDMTFDRAGVAGLANNMIGAYVTADNLSETQEGEDGAVITGTVKGVIVVKGGDKDVAVTIKDVEVPAVIAVGGSVELSGATVETVKVTGANAVVAADKDTTIGTVAIEGDKASVALDGTVKDVTVAGTDANLTVDGEVENVTVAKDATVAEIKGTGVSSENVKNETGESIKVNDEDVAPAPAEPENPDEPEQGGSTGFVPDPPKPPEEVTSGTTGGAAEEDKRGGDTIPAAPTSNDGLTASAGNTLCEANAHNWEDTKVDPTCTSAGTITYTCSTCGATKTETIAMREHVPSDTRKSFDATNHYVLCKYCDHKCTTTAHTWATTDLENYGAGHTAKCTGCDATKNFPHTQVAAGELSDKWNSSNASFHWKKCACNAQFDQAEHTFVWAKDVDQTGAPAGKEKWTGTCECGATKHEERNKTSEGGGDTPAEHQHSWATAWTNDETHHWHNCTADGCTVTDNAQKNGYAPHTAATELDWTDSGANRVKTCTCGKVMATCSDHSSTNVAAAITDGDGGTKVHVTTCSNCGKTLTPTPHTGTECTVEGCAKTPLE